MVERLAVNYKKVKSTKFSRPFSGVCCDVLCVVKWREIALKNEEFLNKMLLFLF